MSVMAVNNMLTRADLDAVPEDGLRHELIDGAFVMTPAPGVGHQRMSRALLLIIEAAVRDTELEVVYAPFDVVLGPHVVEPDLLVAPTADFTDKDLPVAPLLVVEIRSPATAWLDEGRKRTLYEEAGIASYWLLDPATPSIRILQLVDGKYVEVAHATGDQTITVTTPVTVTLNPAVLARG
ncbi:MAG: Uma2 family endonuclease [Candidatus Nanopelagicales bacterium]